MRVLKKVLKEGKVKLLLDTLDDLWYLSTIIDPGDHVSAVTYRRGETHTDAKREKRGEKKRMFLTVKIEKVEFHEFAERLRAMGTITEGPQDHGQHHTLDFEPGDNLTIQKEWWHHHHFERIREAQEAARMPLVTFVSIDDETATLAVLRSQGLQVFTTIHSNIQGKQYDQKGRGDKAAYFKEVIDTLEHQMGSRLASEGDRREKKKEGKEGDARKDVIFLGPGFYKEEIASYARERSLQANIIIESASQAGPGGIREVLKSGVSKVLEKAKASEDERLVDSLLAEISKGGKFTYGHDHVIRALENGAVETLLLTEEFLRDPKMEMVGRLASDTRASIRVISTGYDAGRRLEALGGLAALLRYKLEESTTHE